MIQSEIMALQDAAQDLTSVPFQIDDLTAYGLQVVFSGGGGDLDGTLTIECSNDAVTWITVDGSAQPVTTSTNHYWNVEDASYRWARAVWDYNTGTGNIMMSVTIKEPRNRY